jgi:hypothetical protein
VPRKQRQGANSTPADSRIAAAARAEKTSVDLLVAYTQRAKAASNDIRAEIDLAVTLANRAYTNSGVNMRVRLAAAMPVSGYDESRFSYTTTLNDLTTGSALAAVRQRRNEVGADLVVLVREGGEYCGQAWVALQPSGATSDLGFSQVSRGYCLSRAYDGA